MKKFVPFKHAFIDALAQCPNCLRTWSYDSVDALLDWGNRRIPGMAGAGRECPNCKQEAKLFQSIETSTRATK